MIRGRRGRSPHLYVHHGEDDRRTGSDFSSGNNNVNFGSKTQVWKPKSPAAANKSPDLITSNAASGSGNRFSDGNVTQIDKEMIHESFDNITISCLKDDEFQAPDNKNVNFSNSRQTLKVKSPATTASDREKAPQKPNKSSDFVTSNTASGSENRHLDGDVAQIDKEMFGDLHGTTISCLKDVKFHSAQASDVVLIGEGKMQQSERTNMDVVPFDLCLRKVGTPGNLNPSLLVTNKAKRKEIQRSTEGVKATVLRPGMILLKNYLSLADQAKIVKKCRDLGLGHGGFYEPGYRNGTKLHLKMMCLGKNWDPETSNYNDHRPTDGAKPPSIPDEFNQLVKKAIQDSQAIIIKEVNTSKVKDLLPSMSADICIVNFYSATGRLGLHKDRDEGQDSLKKGLPVVSFSIGDSADFLYGDENDVCKAKTIDLESGDVLIFGGKSRHIYHGVAAILPKTAPKSLLGETSLRPGRLNLTFRQY